jgi:glycosyltransferase involved in cell wall biosynthesis
MSNAGANNSMDKRPRVTIVASHPIQHYCPLYRQLTADGALKVKVIFGARAGLKAYYDQGFNRVVQWQSDLVEGFDHEFLPSAEEADVHRSIAASGLVETLEASGTDIVQIYGYARRISRHALFWARSRGRRVLFQSDSELRAPRPWSHRIVKRLVLPSVFRCVDAFLSVGDYNDEYYLHYKVQKKSIFRSPYPIDEPTLAHCIAVRQDVRRVTRLRHGIADEAIVLLVVGKLIPRKAPGDVIEAVARLKREGLAKDLRVLYAGDGPEIEVLKQKSARIGDNVVEFLGFVPVDILPQYYLSADILVHPSMNDPHPLATSEAVYCGLPVIVSDRTGSVGATDDVRLGKNGMEYPCGDTTALAECLQRLIDNPSLRQSMGRESAIIGRERGLDASVRGYLQAVDYALTRRRASKK